MSRKYARAPMLSFLASVAIVVLISGYSLRRQITETDFKGNSQPFMSATTRQTVTFDAQNLCNTKKEERLLLLWVDTAPSNAEKRHKIRSSWGSVKTYDGTHLATIFFIGGVENVTIQNSIEDEMLAHRDIVQDHSYTDTYLNLTRKGLSALRWISLHCTESLWIVKVDDDTLVNPYNLVSFLRTANATTLEKLICQANTGKPFRDATSKWFVSVEEYSKDRYPVFCQGFAYIIPRNAVGSLLEAAVNVPFLPFEDVYITGLLANYSGLSHYSLSKAQAASSGNSMKSFMERLLESDRRIFIGHARSILQYDVFWQTVSEQQSK